MKDMGRRFLKECFIFLHCILILPISLPYLFTSERELIDGDILRWSDIQGIKGRSRLKMFLLLLCNQVFRTIYLHRLKCGNMLGWFLGAILNTVYGSLPTLRIDTHDIGPGLFIQHGYCTLISAKRIGSNAWINQGVTIGYTNDTDTPTIGNNVVIAAGAKVLGNIMVGDNVKIGANAVVVKSVPSDVTVVGVPARIVRRKGLRISEGLYDSLI